MDYNSLFQLNKKKAIVVGSGGLLGLEIVKALLSQGATVLGLDIVKPRTKLKNFFFQRIDFSKLNKIETELEKNFKSLMKTYEWGTNPYYFLAGKYGIHPTYVQTMLSDPSYREEDILSVIESLRDKNGNKFNKDNLLAGKNFYEGSFSF